MASRSIIPDEIITEILVKLPAKSILRCKTLSKHHYSLINSQYFIRRHLALGRVNPKSIISPITPASVELYDRRGQVLQFTPPFAHEPSITYHGPIVCPPVDGLFFILYPMDGSYAIWNPTTRDHFILPDVPLTPDTGETTRELGSQQWFFYGFGYDDTTDEYKFVFNYEFFPENSNVVSLPKPKPSFNICNISKGEWRNIKQWSGVVPREIGRCAGEFVHGALHWESGCPGSTILAFDMVTESHRFFSFPIVGDYYVWSHVSLVSFNRCLGLVNAQKIDYTPVLSSSFDVWVMAEYGVTQSWTILLRVALPDGLSGRYLGIVGDRFYITKHDGCAVSYDLYSKDEERYDILDGEIGTLMPYEESLVRITKSVS